MTSFDEARAAGVKGCDGALVKIAFLPPFSLTTPSLLICAEAAELASINIPKQMSIPIGALPLTLFLPFDSTAVETRTPLAFYLEDVFCVKSLIDWGTGLAVRSVGGEN